jgi:hypothetical protein
VAPRRVPPARPDPPCLTVTLAQAEADITKRIEVGRELRNAQIISDAELQ